MSKLAQFIKEESGASAAEYVLILAIIGAAIATAAGTLGGAISGALGNAATAINAHAVFP